MVAVQGTHYIIIEHLLNAKNIDVDIKNNEGKRAYDYFNPENDSR